METAGRGVVLEKIGEGSALEQAGLLAGDVLLSWERRADPTGVAPDHAAGAADSGAPPEQGEFNSFFDWLRVKIAQAPRGTIRFLVERREERLALSVAVGWWEAEVRPRLRSAELGEYLEGKRLIEAGEGKAGHEAWERLARRWGEEGRPLDAAWLFLTLAGTNGEKQSSPAVSHAAKNALRIAAAHGHLVVMAILKTQLAGVFEARNDYSRSAQLYAEALHLWEEVSADGLGMAECLDRFAKMTRFRGELDAAEHRFQKALEIRERLAPLSLETARTLNGMGLVAYFRSDLEVARDYFHRALEIKATLAPRSLEVALTLNNLGLVEEMRDDLTVAEEFYKRALTIQEARAPKSRDVAMSLNNLGVVADKRGRLAEAEEYYLRALEIAEESFPGSLDLAHMVNNLGLIAGRRGDLATSESHHRRALEIRSKLAPGTLHAAGSFFNLGNLAVRRGDLDAAEEHHLRALEIKQTHAPRSLQLALSLSALGSVAFARGDLSTARDSFEGAAAIQEREAPEGTERALTLLNLGTVARSEGDLAAAEHHFRQALLAYRKIAPESLDAALGLFHLGDLALRRNDFEDAERLHRHCLAVRQKVAPGSLAVAESLLRLGAVADDRDRPEDAQNLYLEALGLVRRWAPGSSLEAETQYRLGTLHRRRGALVPARRFLSSAVLAFESQNQKLGGSDLVRSSFSASFAEYYQAYIDLLLELGRDAEAFHVVERYRARNFLALLAERDLLYKADLSEELDRERHLADANYDRLLNRLAKLPADSEQARETQRRLRAARRRQDEIQVKIRAASPRLASLRYPQPLDLDAVRRTLDPGTLLLSYVIVHEKSYLFAVAAGTSGDAGGLTVQPLEIGAAQIRDQVEAFRDLISGAHSGLPFSRENLERLGRHLYQVLIAPVADLVEASERLLILPDGPLHVLPFGALVRPVKTDRSSPARDWQYLVEWKPFHCVLSATVYGELRKRRSSPARRGEGDAPLDFAGFGDPRYPAGADPAAVADLRVRSAAKRGLLDFEPLPHSRQEVEEIAAMYPSGTARSFLQEEASEERAKAVAPRSRILHFATHGTVDDQFPLSSGLALSIPEKLDGQRDNGLLQAWEIFEHLRIRADLVVLSACETGLGRELGGEGLYGLIRAFQYAGARSVVASLWGVADQTSAELMVLFHKSLKAGTSKDEALRAAQIELIRKPLVITDRTGRPIHKDASLPYYWATFQLNGDWR